MKLHEYQAKDIFLKYGIPVPKGQVATTSSQAATATFDIGEPVVVKAQVHAGGRGKAGGVKLVKSPGEAESFASNLLKSNLVTYQTGPEGVPVNSVLVEEAINISEEFYLGMVIDGSSKGVVAIASKEGGVNIEEVAENTPEKIITIPIDPVLGLQPFQGRKIAYALGLNQENIRKTADLIQKLYAVFIDNDATLIEINPLVLTSDNQILAADAKLDIDDDSIFRHQEIKNISDISQEDTLEVEARDFDINYVKLDGNIGCIVNGAGLAMATMDVASSAGASPANFLDIGGGATEEKVAKALSLVLSDNNVTAVLVNLFGGILRCDIAARGFVMCIEESQNFNIPLIVRMLGTNAEEGIEILKNSNLNVSFVDTLEEAASKISKYS
ncbi:MAG: ADP-forming succinate--CoA ligase subunit beta [SAR202 cluster bacterium]|nr:ADP-forming succinate--CoA ligase subunit beta [SAR202 cluster bacterium]